MKIPILLNHDRQRPIGSVEVENGKLIVKLREGARIDSRRFFRIFGDAGILVKEMEVIDGMRYLKTVEIKDFSADETFTSPETIWWVIHYEDKDRLPEHFSGTGAEAAARRRMRQLSMSWSCHLFRRVELDQDQDGPNYEADQQL